ncbi:MAG: methylenetetrahydrofolate reductase [NAD(P)H] [Bacillota bacterium]|jgi:methylenetetrahydrofolate reductase (NADPH)
MNISGLFKKKKTIFSLEVFPPKKTSSSETIYNTLYDLRTLPVDFISVTYGAGGSSLQKNKTCEISALIKKEYNTESLSHLTCISSTKEDIVEILQKLKQNQICNILALRGDINPDLPPQTDFKYASDLVSFIKEYDDSFNLVGACYPEGHLESANLATDIKNLKIKVQSGVGHLISQLFFDNKFFYNFMEKALSAGIDVPVQAGIMPIVHKSQIEKIVSMCGATLPAQFIKMIDRYSDDPISLKDAGLGYATKQIIDLLDHGVQGIHLYTMNNTEVATKVYHNIKDKIGS